MKGGRCSGNGRCVSMRRLALSHKDSETFQPDPLEYGSKPYDPRTWDADRIFGCMADEYGYVEDIHNISAFVGPNLEHLTCPDSFDARLSFPRVISNENNTFVRNETQQLRCEATGGYFELEFRGARSGKIFFNASTLDLQNSLQSMSTIGTVELSYDPPTSSAPICSGGLNWINIIFTSELGNLPRLVLHNGTLEGITIFDVMTHQDGGGQLFECSGRGDCDRTTGECQCWSYRTSSDGFGTYQGRRGDCAYSLYY